MSESSDENIVTTLLH